MGATSLNDRVIQVTKLLAGTQKRYPDGSQTLTFGGADHTVDEVHANLQRFVDHRAAVEAAKASVRAKVDAERAELVSLLAYIGEYVKYLLFTFGHAADALVDFGVAPPRARTPMTAETKAIAAAKRQATREARGITTKKAKQGIRGNVTAKLVVTPAAPAAPAAEPSPAATPAPTAGAAPPNGR
jgi:hypothetical protein